MSQQIRRSTFVLMSVLLCAGLLAACGDSGSDASKTQTATVPSGQLGAAAVTCKPPKVAHDVVVFGELQATNVSCDVARAAAATYWKNVKLDGWTCTKTSSGSTGRRSNLSCTNDADTSQKFTTYWDRS